MLVFLQLLIFRLINRSGLRISHSKVFSSGMLSAVCTKNLELMNLALVEGVETSFPNCQKDEMRPESNQGQDYEIQVVPRNMTVGE